MSGNPKRLQKEFSDLTAKPKAGCSVSLVNDDLYHWIAQVQGPAGTPYEGGVFKVDLQIPQQYPHKAPEIKFITKIYHPNIDAEGRACLDILKTWQPSVKMERLIGDIVKLLESPNGERAVQGEIGVEFMNQRQVFDQKAKQWTAQYAH